MPVRIPIGSRLRFFNIHKGFLELRRDFQAMKVWKTIYEAERELNAAHSQTVVTVGNFDGVHLGHQAIMSQVTRIAKTHQWLGLVLTFSNHTESFLGKAPPLLNTPAIRRALLAEQGIDAVLEVEFDHAFAELDPAVFFQKWLVEGLKVQAMVVGYDFRFGTGGQGDFALLRNLCQQSQIRLEQVRPVQVDGITVSSSAIRKYLAAGEIEIANQLLGYSFHIITEVIAGEQRGRKMGFPTANLFLDESYLLPRYGVYLVRVSSTGQIFYGVANVGVKPTFDGQVPLVEVYLLDTSINLYHRQVQVDFLYYLRPEVRFGGMTELQEQIQQDVARARELLSRL